MSHLGHLTLTPATLLSLTFALGVLALLPSVSTLTVTARAAAGGWRQGLWTTLGVVLGDVIFVLIALLGLHQAVRQWPWVESLLLVAGGALMLGLAARLWRSAASATDAPRPSANRGMAFGASAFSSVKAGLLITLADQKALLFYLGFFPAFLALDGLTLLDTLILVLIVVFSVGGAKCLYAAVASRAATALPPHWHLAVQRLACLILALVGIHLWSRLL